MNYWTIDYLELPSRGIYYPLDGEILIRPLTVNEVKYLATYTPANAVKIVNEILRKCLELRKIDFNDILLADREYLTFWIRANSFTQNGGYNITAQCPICKTEIEQTVLCDDFKVDFIEGKYEKIPLPDAGIVLPVKQPQIKDIRVNRITSSMDELTNIAMCIDTDNNLEDKRKFILNLTAYDYSILKHAMDNFHCGMHKTVNIECPNCHAIHKCTLDITDSKLFSMTKTREILEEITHIAKYTHVQITDDWLWREVEIERIIVNDMIKKENDEQQKEMQKAKSKANAAMSRAGISAPGWD